MSLMRELRGCAGWRATMKTLGGGSVVLGAALTLFALTAYPAFAAGPHGGGGGGHAMAASAPPTRLVVAAAMPMRAAGVTADAGAAATGMADIGRRYSGARDSPG